MVLILRRFCDYLVLAVVDHVDFCQDGLIIIIVMARVKALIVPRTIPLGTVNGATWLHRLIGLGSR